MPTGEFNYTPNRDHTYDAIVIGSGISGGWAAKELCEGGLKTLVLERGKNVVHLKDYPTATKNPWDFKHRGYMPLKVKEENPIVSKCYAFDESTEHFFVKTSSTHTSSKNHLIGYAATRLGENHCYGQGKPSDGA